MTHAHHHHPHHDEPGHAEVLDLDARVFGAHLDDLIEWVRRHAPETPRRIADVGAGTGAGALALARRFPTAEIVAIDQSPAMLDRVRAAAHAQGLDDRLRAVQADLDAGWPAIGAVDVVWAASSLHHVADPDRVLGDIHAALTPGGLLAVVEMDTLPRFLPDDIGVGRPGLEARCHEAAARAGWNAHPDWRPHLERAGFEMAGQHTLAVEASPAPPDSGRYAHAMLSRFRSAFDGRLSDNDLGALDHLLARDHPGALLNRPDLTVRGSRTVWAARRPRTNTTKG
ncbi:trans-aconitate 2-methyltransferase [Microbispora sp. KK1-11]|uniref:class I SAM-dependent methyltransferase n=1 Tax=Microbispora sp. KK1-11 TaxID=2053005 RepID=UPI00115C05B0|nr:class I SAM-dependent methyltransferase [Microbispora sp. KK1-11]TQS24592.1 methyltransferase domain-containing protein [Microbispora sp. KK1-11]